MENKKGYTSADCEEIGYDCSLKNKVVVLSQNALPADDSNQLFFCSGGNGANPNPIGRSVFLNSLLDGEPCRFNRSDVMGTAKPEILSDHAKLQLSQLRPAGAKSLKDNEPQFSGYCFLENGRYNTGVWLCSHDEVKSYIEMQKPYQHRIMVCDRDDFCVFEMQCGEVLYPTQEAIEKLEQEQKESSGMGGMTMQ